LVSDPERSLNWRAKGGGEGFKEAIFYANKGLYFLMGREKIMMDRYNGLKEEC